MKGPFLPSWLIDNFLSKHFLKVAIVRKFLFGQEDWHQTETYMLVEIVVTSLDWECSAVTLLQVDLSWEEVIFECKQHLSLNNLADLPDFSSFHEWFIAAVVYIHGASIQSSGLQTFFSKQYWIDDMEYFEQQGYLIKKRRGSWSKYFVL